LVVAVVVTPVSTLRAITLAAIMCAPLGSVMVPETVASVCADAREAKKTAHSAGATRHDLLTRISFEKSPRVYSSKFRVSIVQALSAVKQYTRVHGIDWDVDS
jgi:hypothetical protein